MLTRSILLLVILFAVVPAAATEYYVATTGDNANTGLSRDHAWRTVNHAADRVRAGDTVIIAEGTYSESVRIRATGDQSAPITFKAAPGEKVLFDGRDRALRYAFYAAYKSHLRFDGLYFVGFNGLGNYTLPWSDQMPGNGNSGVFALYRSDDVQITRCFSDGRGLGYSPGLVIAKQCADLLVRNCVVISSMGGGLHILYSPNMRIENNVFLVPMISATILQNNKGHVATLANNIITDNIGAKHHVRLLYNSDPVDEGTHNNCFFVRTSDEPRPWSELGTMDSWFAAIAERYNHTAEQHQIFTDPRFRGTLGHAPLDRHGKPMFLGDFLMEKEDLDFLDLFATDPEVIRRGMGLDPEAFSDFHFHHASP